jgi:Transposase DDE domain group 1
VTECNSQIDLLSIGCRMLTARFDEETLTSDAGVVFVGAADKRLGLTKRLNKVLRDRRSSRRVRHGQRDLLRQRIYQIAAGYEDANDADSLRHDAAFQVALGRVPAAGSLASQPTLSRFEQRSNEELFRMSEVMLEVWIERLIARAKRTHRRTRIVLDLDSSDLVAHGQQELALFHGHYHNYIYYPLLAFDSEGWPVAFMLRPGRTRSAGVIAMLGRIIERLTFALPSFELTLRADAGFSSPDLYAFCEAANIRYVIGLITHQKLRERAEPWLAEARAQVEATGQTVRLLRGFDLQWGKGNPVRRIVTKAEVTPIGDNPRFLITNLTETPERVYELYTGRGNCENAIKELKNALRGDRMSCHSFRANQFRLLLHMAAYVLMFTLREQLADTSLASAQFDTLRLRLVKIAASVSITARRIWLRLSATHPSRDLFRLLALDLRGSPA